MSDIQKIKKEALRLIKGGEIRSTLDFLLSQEEDNLSQSQELISLSERFETLMSEKEQNNLDHDAYTVGRNRIVYALQTLVFSMGNPSSNTQNGDSLDIYSIKEQASWLLENKGITQVLNYLQLTFEGISDIENAVVMLFARWNALKREKGMGFHSKKDYREYKKRIEASVRYNIEHLDKFYSENEEDNSVFESQIPQKTEPQKLLLRIILLLLIAIIMGIGYIIFHLPA